MSERYLKEWRCCGNIWQLIMSKQFPERYNWRPRCPVCNKVVYQFKIFDLKEVEKILAVNSLFGALNSLTTKQKKEFEKSVNLRF